MPVPPTLFGRESELGRLETWARDAVSRPLLITGPGGIGKTALLRAFMAMHPEGRTVDCTHCSSVEEVGVAIASALDVDAVRAMAPRQLARRAKELGVSLLALDNVERLAAQSTELDAFFGLVPHTLATSRIALGLPRELTMVLTPLACGAAADAAASLLRWRSGLADDLPPEESALLARIAGMTDGIPLALELAATQISTFGLAWTAERLAKGLLALDPNHGSGTERGPTLVATFRWSWDCLGERERAAVTRLALFSGLFSLVEAARVLETDAAGAAGIVSTLTRHSWVRVEPDGRSRRTVATPGEEPRFRVLVPLREFARLRLDESVESEVVRDRHEETVLSIVEPARADLRSTRAREAVHQIARFYPDLLDMMRSGRGGPARAARIARATEVAARWSIETVAFVSFAEAAETPTAEAAVESAPRASKLRAWVAHAKVDSRRGRLRESIARAERAMKIAESDDEVASCLLVLSDAHGYGGDVEAAYQTAMEARELCQAPELGGEIGLAIAWTARWLGLEAEARAAATEGIAVARRAGDIASEASNLAMLAALSRDAGELPRAELAAREAVQLVDEHSLAGVWVRAVLAETLVEKQAWDEADACLEHIVRGTDDQVMSHLAAVFTRAHIRFKRGLLEEARALLESQAGKGQELSIRVLLDALSAAVYARSGLMSKAERAAEAVYARSSGTVERVIARTFLLVYELERLRLDARDEDARRRVEASLQLLGDVTERGRSWLASSSEVRGALATVRDALVGAGFRVPSEREQAPELVVEGGADQATLAGRTLPLRQRHTLRQILLGLVDAPRGTELSVEGVFALGWPGERVAARAARNRVHVALATLRRELLGPWLRRSRSGYSLDPAVTVVRS